jgi:hypothetical protein
MPADRDQWLLAVATSVVIDLPVSNAVRAAAYRMLTTMPRVRGLGEVHDMHGRSDRVPCPAAQLTGITQDLVLEPIGVMSAASGR